METFPSQQKNLKIAKIFSACIQTVCIPSMLRFRILIHLLLSQNEDLVLKHCRHPFFYFRVHPILLSIVVPDIRQTAT